MDRDIAGHILALKGALAADDEKLGMEVALALLAGALNDLRRIADAFEILATAPPPSKFGNPQPHFTSP